MNEEGLRGGGVLGDRRLGDCGNLMGNLGSGETMVIVRQGPDLETLLVLSLLMMELRAWAEGEKEGASCGNKVICLSDLRRERISQRRNTCQREWTR
jgi:hypothetical protein